MHPLEIYPKETIPGKHKDVAEGIFIMELFILKETSGRKVFSMSNHSRLFR